MSTVKKITRSLLRIRLINQTIRYLDRAILPRTIRGGLAKRLPIVNAFPVKLPNGTQVNWEPQGDIITTAILNGGWDGYECPSSRLFFGLAVDARVILDIGAYLGYFALLGAAAQPGNRAFAFEAVPSTARHCQRIFRCNPHLAIELVASAVTEHSGAIDIFVPRYRVPFIPREQIVGNNSTIASLHPGRRGIRVRATSIDDFVRARGLPGVDLVKIDTETTEPDVLAGMSETVRRFRPTILLEVLAEVDTTRLTAFIKQNNYVCAWITSEGLRPMDTVVAGTFPDATNQLFLPAEKKWPTRF